MCNILPTKSSHMLLIDLEKELMESCVISSSSSSTWQVFSSPKTPQLYLLTDRWCCSVLLTEWLLSICDEKSVLFALSCLPSDGQVSYVELDHQVVCHRDVPPAAQACWVGLRETLGLDYPFTTTQGAHVPTARLWGKSRGSRFC